MHVSRPMGHPPRVARSAAADQRRTRAGSKRKPSLRAQLSRASIQKQARENNVMDIVDGFRFVSGATYMNGLRAQDHTRFVEFFDHQVKPDPCAAVRDRGMIKIVYDRATRRV